MSAKLSPKKNPSCPIYSFSKPLSLKRVIPAILFSLLATTFCIPTLSYAARAVRSESAKQTSDTSISLKDNSLDNSFYVAEDLNGKTPTLINNTNTDVEDGKLTVTYPTKVAAAPTTEDGLITLAPGSSTTDNLPALSEDGKEVSITFSVNKKVAPGQEITNPSELFSTFKTVDNLTPSDIDAYLAQRGDKVAIHFEATGGLSIEDTLLPKTSDIARGIQNIATLALIVAAISIYVAYRQNKYRPKHFAATSSFKKTLTLSILGIVATATLIAVAPKLAGALTVSSDATIELMVEPNIEVSFDANGGAFPAGYGDPETIVFNGYVTKPVKAPTPDTSQGDVVFSGYSTAKDLESTKFSFEQRLQTRGLTLFALWLAPKQFTITYADTTSADYYDPNDLLTGTAPTSANEQSKVSIGALPGDIKEGQYVSSLKAVPDNGGAAIELKRDITWTQDPATKAVTSSVGWSFEMPSANVEIVPTFKDAGAYWLQPGLKYWDYAKANYTINDPTESGAPADDHLSYRGDKKRILLGQGDIDFAVDALHDKKTLEDKVEAKQTFEALMNLDRFHLLTSYGTTTPSVKDDFIEARIIQVGPHQQLNSSSLNVVARSPYFNNAPEGTENAFTSSETTGDGTVLTFQMTDSLPTGYSMRSSVSTAGGWAEPTDTNSLYAKLQDGQEIYSKINETLTDNLTEVSKISTPGGQSGPITTPMTAPTSKLWLLSYAEMVGSVYNQSPWYWNTANKALVGEGSQYTFWNGKVANNFGSNPALANFDESRSGTTPSGSSRSWWERSCSPYDSELFLCVTNTGVPATNSYAPVTRSVVLGFSF